jgi:hypothetical protein
MGHHAQKHPDRDGLAWNNGGGVRHQFSPDQLASLVGLPASGVEQAHEQRDREKSVAQWTRGYHPVTYHQRIFAATCRTLARSLL